MADPVGSVPAARRATGAGDPGAASGPVRSPGSPANGAHALKPGGAGDPRHALGLRGERIAEAWLTARGFRLIDRRYRRRTGEIDLILDDGGTVVFVEVKSRRRATAGRPAEAVTVRKTERLASTALHFLQERGWLERPARFDVVEVLATPGRAAKVHHIQDAFRPSG
jgi:putative endonuclease